MRNRLIKLFLLCLLGLSSAFGVPMNPKDVEELQEGMSQAKENRLEDHGDSGDPDTTDDRHHGS